MRRLTAVALAALTALSLQSVPTNAQPQQDRRMGDQGWRSDQAPDERWYDRDDFERRGRNDIDCPMTQVRREITTQIPEGWWNTPSIDYLSGTEVQTIGGRRTLVCKYGNSGQIMRLEPRRRDCAPRRGGFDCRRERQGFPGGPGGPGGQWPGGPGGPGGQGGTFSEGQIDLRQTYQVDLDQGRIGSNGADLWFHAISQNDLYLEPMAGARLGWAGSGSCRDVNLTNERIALGRVNVGTKICYRTDEGRTGEFRVTGFNQQGGSRTISFDYQTWGGGRR